MHVVLLKAHLNQGGGLEKYAMRICNAFLQKGNEVTFLTAKPPVGMMQASYAVFPPRNFLPKFLQIEQFDREVGRHLAKMNADIVLGMDRNREQTHIRAGNGVHAAFLKSRMFSEGKAKYWLCHLNPLHRKILQIEKAAFENPRLKKVFVNSYKVQHELLEYYAIEPGRIEVIHNGVEWKEHEPLFQTFEADREATLQHFGLNGNRFHLLFIGNGYKRKGLDVLLKALSLWKFKDFHLSVIGKEKRLRWYQWKTKQLQLENQVRFFGPQKNVIPFYQMADVLVIPSFYDPFANVTLEGLSLGLFVISSKENGGSEVLTEQNGTCIENLTKIETVLSALDRSLLYRKTKDRAHRIRSSVAHLDFSLQLSKLIDACG